MNLNESSDMVMRHDSSMELWVFWALCLLLSRLQREGKLILNSGGNG